VLVALLNRLSYLALFGLLVAGGLAVPIPEELVQLTAGYLARRGVLSLAPAMAFAWLGLLTGDYLLFRMGRRLGPAVLRSPRLARWLTPARRALVERHFARHAVLTIAAARHASGFRLPVFALAGASGVRDATFLLADGASALLSVPLVMGLGWLLADRLLEARKEIHEVELALGVLALLASVAWWIVSRRRERRKAREDAGASRDGPGPGGPGSTRPVP
jgi:membrane protein DedA with SNARE-associated domain